MGVWKKIVLICLLVSVTYASDEVQDDPSKPHFVFVHGLSRGGWTWYKMKASLESHGYKVSCPDLTSAGIDTTPATSVRNLSSYNQPLMELLHKIPNDEKIILVGHSEGGLTLTHVMYKFGYKIKVYVFVSAVILKRGTMERAYTNMGLPLKYGLEKTMGENATAADDIPMEDVALFELLAKRAPTSKISKEARYPNKPEIEKLNHAYIRCLHDMVLRRWTQNAMIEKWPPTMVFDIPTRHNPHLSSPYELTKISVQVDKLWQ